MSSNVILTSNIAQLQLISQYVSTTVGFVILFFGVVGNLLNILTLIKLGNHKHNTSSLYILVKSFFDLIVLFVGLFAVILNHGLSINSMSTNVVWCKARIPLIYINGFSSFTCLCLHSIDTFLATSNSAYWRRKSNVRTARILIIGFLFLWIGHELPYFFIQDTFNLRCVSTNGAYTQYSTYFIAFGLFAIIPVSIVSIFGYLSYRHVHSQLLEDTHRPLSRLTKQMTSMALFQIINIVGFSIPNGIIQAYFLASANLNKDPHRQAQEQFVQLFFNVLLCGLYADSFYCYCIASKRYRKQVLDALKKFLKRNSWSDFGPCITFLLQFTYNGQQRCLSSHFSYDFDECGMCLYQILEPFLNNIFICILNDLNRPNIVHGPSNNVSLDDFILLLVGSDIDEAEDLNSLIIVAQDDTGEQSNLEAQRQFLIKQQNIKSVFNEKGLDGVIHYIIELSEEWKKQKVSIALVGQSGSGKSTLINRFRSLLPDDEGAADVAGGIRECTTGIDEYPMKGTNVIYYDLPGVGTRRFPFHDEPSQLAYTKTFELAIYDYFIIVVRGRFTEDDWNLARYISERLKRSYSFVLTHVDVMRQDFKYRQYEKTYDFSYVKDKIREDIRYVLRDANPDKIFLISNQITERKESGDYVYNNDPEYEFDRLVQQIHRGMATNKKSEAFIMSTKSISEHAIRAKADVLRSYVKYWSLFSGATGSIPLPMVSAGIDIAITMNNARIYYDAFGLKGSDTFKKLILDEGTLEEKIDHMLKVISVRVGARVAAGIAGTMLIEETLKFVPFVGSVTGVGLSYITTSYLLHSLISYFEHDALLMIKARVIADDSDSKFRHDDL
ncbi:unnamed protein product [Rotaria socialis]|uniref:G-protein coupled receptors family 1 profile domain-containing protein n=1 Tax=Rotaria socialis TaxID=392032 RepID=A0A820DK67_9BILA|nr:unnamed protein product [Rotaria socialis]